VARDKEEAVRWYKKAAKQGLPEAMYNVGISYFNGEGVPADLNFSYAYMLAAESHGDAQADEALNRIRDEMSGHTDIAKLKLGEMYEKGEDLPKELGKAATIYLEIAHANYKQVWFASRAQFKVCRLYETGTGVPLDLSEAKSWCKKAASELPEAMITLGQMAEKDSNPAEAQRWYEKAIQRGDRDGFLPLANLKLQGGPAGEREAYFLLYLAKVFNVAGSDLELQQVAACLRASDRKKQEKRAYRWVEKNAPQKAQGMKRP
jgi:TPR repeat protein